MSYQVSLEVFEGPFDLLLQLIARKKLDVTEVGLAEITADFLAYLTDLDDLDLETATRFLVVAATLIELKAARLLPAEERQELEDLLGEARDLLYARLLEYRAFRDVARILSHRLVQHEAHLSREVAPESWIGQLVPDAPLPIDAEGLAALAAAATTPEPEPTVDLSHIRRSYVSIREAALTMLSTLPASGVAAPFRELVEGRDRGDRVVFFLALLELFKLGHVGLEQPDHRGPLGVTRTLGGRDLASVVDELNDDEPDDEPADDAPGDDPDGRPGGAPAEDPPAEDPPADDTPADDTPTDDTAAPAPTGASS